MSSNIKLKNEHGNTTIISSGSDATDITLDGSKILKQVDTIASLRAMSEKPSTVYVTGYHTAGDNAFGSNFYKLIESAGVDNGGTIIVPTGVTTYNYALQYSGAVNAKWFGAKGDGIADDTTAIQSAITVAIGGVYIPKGNYLITAELSNIGNCTRIFGDGEVDTILTKAFNGNVFDIINQGTLLEDFYVLCDGGNYTGGGIYVTADDTIIKRVRITDSAESCIICKANTVGSNGASNTVVEDCYLNPFDATTFYGIRSDGNDLSASPTIRNFNRLKGTSIVNFAGMNRVVLSNSFGTKIGFDSSSSKVSVIGNRFSSQVDFTVFGTNHTFSSNVFGFGIGSNLKIDSTAQGILFDFSNGVLVDGSLSSSLEDLQTKDGSGSLNTLFTKLEGFQTVWKGGTSDAVIGDGTLQSTCKRNGRTCTVDVNLVKGSTTSIPVGIWSFTMPFKAISKSTTPVMVKSSSGIWYSAIGKIDDGNNQMYITLNASDGPMDETDLAFSTNAQIIFSLTYDISFT